MRDYLKFLLFFNDNFSFYYFEIQKFVNHKFLGTCHICLVVLFEWLSYLSCSRKNIYHRGNNLRHFNKSTSITFIQFWIFHNSIMSSHLNNNWWIMSSEFHQWVYWKHEQLLDRKTFLLPSLKVQTFEFHRFCHMWFYDELLIHFSLFDLCLILLLRMYTINEKLKKKTKTNKIEICITIINLQENVIGIRLHSWIVYRQRHVVILNLTKFSLLSGMWMTDCMIIGLEILSLCIYI